MNEYVYMFSKNNTAPVFEACNVLRANIEFLSVGKTIKTLAIVSAVPLEGRTVVSQNLAASFAYAGKNVLLVDTDLRKPTIVKRSEKQVAIGLVNYLNEKVTLEEIIYPTNIENMFFIPCGEHAVYPTKIISSTAFDELLHYAAEHFDYVVFDSPSVNSVIDASMIAAKADGAVVVVCPGKVSHKEFSRAKEQLEKAHANIIGAVLNKVSSHEFNRYFNYYPVMEGGKESIPDKLGKK